MRRPGHHRPLGTTAKMRFSDWPRTDPWPELGDLAAKTVGPGGDPDELERAYEVVGIAETRTGYRLTAERIAYDRFVDRAADVALGNEVPQPPHLLRDRLHENWTGIWTFYDLPRR